MHLYPVAKYSRTNHYFRDAGNRTRATWATRFAIQSRGAENRTRTTYTPCMCTTTILHPDSVHKNIRFLCVTREKQPRSFSPRHGCILPLYDVPIFYTVRSVEYFATGPCMHIYPVRPPQADCCWGYRCTTARDSNNVHKSGIGPHFRRLCHWFSTIMLLPCLCKAQAPRANRQNHPALPA